MGGSRPRRISWAGVLLVAALCTPTPGAEPTDRLGRAVQLNHEGHREEARRLLDAIVAAEPANHRALWNRGLVAMEDGNDDAAIEWFDRAIAVDGEIADYHLWRGYAYARKIERAGAFGKLCLAPRVRRAFERAVALAPDSIKAHEALMQYYRRAPRFLGGGERKALAQSREIRRLAAARAAEEARRR